MDMTVPSSPRHVLLTVLGITPRPAVYVLGERTATAGLAPVGLLRLLDDNAMPDHVVALCTKEAYDDSWPLLTAGLPESIGATHVPLENGVEADPLRFPDVVARALADDTERLTLDLTHGPRHLSIMAYVAALYVAALRRIPIAGAWYGQLERDVPSPFLDLQPLVRLPDLVYAVRVLHDTGSAGPLAKAVAATNETVARNLRGHADAYLSGLPMEVGRSAERVLEARRPLRQTFEQQNVPLASSLTDRVLADVQPLVLKAGGGDGWKRKVLLTTKELQRQAILVDSLLLRRQLSAAFGLMSEWLTSSAVLQLGLEHDWLERRSRATARAALQRISHAPASGLDSHLTEEQRVLGAFVGKLDELRNAFHHSGMRGEPLIDSSKYTKITADVERIWEQVIRDRPLVDLSFGGPVRGVALVSPVGQRPGSLYSAALAVRDRTGSAPDFCLVLASRETEPLVAGALEHAGAADHQQILLMADPLTGTNELAGLASRSMSALVGFDSIMLNLTGGTTLMGLAVERIASKVERQLGPVLRRFGVVDTRSSQEQYDDPYVQGSAVWLDD